MSSNWAARNPADRALGEDWEGRFDTMARANGFEVHRPGAPEPWWPDKGLLPDRVTNREGETEWHELKHKRPTWHDEYGLEDYRLAALVKLAQYVNEPVLYTIHDWELSGASKREEPVENALEDWLTADILDLAQRGSRLEEGKTYHSSQTAKAQIHYWPSWLWTPLTWRWGIDVQDKSQPRQTREAAWAIVKDSHGMETTGHGKAVSWARAYLELDGR